MQGEDLMEYGAGDMRYAPAAATVSLRLFYCMQQVQFPDLMTHRSLAIGDGFLAMQSQ